MAKKRFSAPMSELRRSSAIKKQPKTYRYDSSLAPELVWDESAERDFAEWLLNLIAAAAEPALPSERITIC